MGNKASFTAGAIFGATVALAVAPQSGAETRAQVYEKVRELLKKEGVEDLVPEEAQALYEQVASKSQDFVSKAGAYAKEAVEGVSAVAKPQIDKSDELREKIEAARQRIAAQVVQNAEDATSTDEIEVEVAPYTA